MELLELTAGTRCLYQGREVELRQVLDLRNILGVYTDSGNLASLPIKELKPLESASEEKYDTFLHVSPAAYAKAEDKLKIIQPLLQGTPSEALVEEIALREKKGPSTIWRWLSLYRQGSLLALVEKGRSGGRNKSRLSPDKEKIVQEVIAKHFLTKQSKAPAHVFEELRIAFRLAGKEPPAENTLRKRLKELAPRLLEEKRLGARAAKERFDPTHPSTMQAPHPLALVQLDHALLNIVLVHEESRLPMSRPWLTIAMDVYSRMVVGLHLAFEEPGAGGTGQCLAHAILPKETWLSQRDIIGEWPCWGVMETLQLDNAREFHGTMLHRASEHYGIVLRYRPPKQPEYGGHIERLIRTIKFRVRRLAGSLITRRRGRRLEMPQRAIFSLPEFERWLTTYLIAIYHHQKHKTLGVSPYEQYQQGILGTPSQPGIGPRPRLRDEMQVRLDFMPFVERSIQRYGVLVDHFHYYAEILRPFIGHNTPLAAAKKQVRFIFKRDPHDLRYLYFLHPSTQQYHRIPLANMNRPVISLWEYRQIVRRELALNPDRKRLTEDLIFKGLAALKAIEREAARRTNKMTKAARRLLEIVPKSANTPRALPEPPAAESIPSATPVDSPFAPIFLNVKPFEELEDGTSHFRSS